MRIIRKMLSLVIAVSLMASMALPCFAGEYDLDNGDILIDFREDDNNQVVQHVTQNEVSAPDSDPLIYCAPETSTSNTITVDTDPGQTAQFTIENVNIQTVPQESGIDFTAGTTAEMTVSGANTVNNTPVDATSGTFAGIHIGNQADVTIQGAAEGVNSLTVNAAGSEKTSGAGIGTNQYEDFTGTLTVTGNVTVEGNGVKYGAGVGSGQGGDFTGTLNVQDGATLVGGNSDEGTGKVTVEDTALINVWTGTLDTSKGSSAISNDRDSYKNAFQKDGSMQQLPPDQLPLITNGAEVEIVHVPQAQATGKTTDASNDTIVTDGFWSDLEKKILGAEKGETITADTGSRTTMPTSILKLLNHQEVNLILQWDGGEDIHIRWDHNVEIQGSAIALETLQQLTR